MMRMACLLVVLSLFSCNSSNYECEYASATVDSIRTEWRRIDGRLDYCGKETKHINPTIAKWETIFDSSLVKGVKVTCKRRYTRQSPACPEDSLFLTAYANGIIVEDGTLYSAYWITGKFPKLKNGLLPGMKHDEVKELMGTPQFEEPCKWAYKCSDNAIVFFFKNDTLSSICYSESESCD
jgi:hypothetical protein